MLMATAMNSGLYRVWVARNLRFDIELPASSSTDRPSFSTGEKGSLRCLEICLNFI